MKHQQMKQQQIIDFFLNKHAVETSMNQPFGWLKK